MPLILIKTNKIKQKPHLKFTQCMTICCIKTRKFFKEKNLLAQNKTENIQTNFIKRGTYIRKIAFLSNLKLNQLKSSININR